NWFGGRYGDGKRFFATFAVDPASYLDMYPEIRLPAEQREAFLRERTSAIVGKRLLDVFGWRLGQDVTIQGTIFGGDWTFTIRGVYTPSDRVINDDMLIFRHDYFDERIRSEERRVGKECRARWWAGPDRQHRAADGRMLCD